jgi:hypothetical protein
MRTIELQSVFAARVEDAEGAGTLGGPAPAPGE